MHFKVAGGNTLADLLKDVHAAAPKKWFSTKNTGRLYQLADADTRLRTC